MIPSQEKFSGLEPITGTIDEILNHQVNVDHVYSLENAVKEIMEEFEVSYIEALTMYKQAEKELIQKELDKLEKSGIVEIIGNGKDGMPLYALTNKKKKKKTIKKKK